MRRRHLGKWDTDEREYNLLNVARLCRICHDYLDTELGEERGGEVIQGLIDRRKNVFLLEDL